MTSGDAFRDARLAALAAVRAALDENVADFRTLRPALPDEDTDFFVHALITVAAVAVMDAAEREGITTTEYLGRETRKTIMGNDAPPSGSDGSAS